MASYRDDETGFRNQREVDRYYGVCPDCGDAGYPRCRCNVPDPEPPPRPNSDTSLDEVDPDVPF